MKGDVHLQSCLSFQLSECPSFLPACVQMLTHNCINENYVIANNLMKTSYGFFERNCGPLTLGEKKKKSVKH